MSRERSFQKSRFQRRRSLSLFGLLCSVLFGVATAAAVLAFVLQFFLGVDVRSEVNKFASSYIGNWVNARSQANDKSSNQFEGRNARSTAKDSGKQPNALAERVSSPGANINALSPKPSLQQGNAATEHPRVPAEESTTDLAEISGHANPDNNPKAAMPDADTYQDILKVYGRTFQLRYENARTKSEKEAICKEIFKKAMAFRENKKIGSDSMYVGLNLARHIAIEIASIELADQIILQMSSNFRLNSVTLRLHTCQGIANRLNKPAEKSKLAKYLLAVADDLQAFDVLDLESTILELAEEILNGSEDENLTSRLSKKQLAHTQKKHDFQLHSRLLTDEDQNLDKQRAILVYQVCYSVNWREGLTRLSVLPNADEAATIARRIIKHSSVGNDMLTGEAIMELAEIAKQELSSFAAAKLKIRAGECFRNVIQSNSGFASEAADRIAEVIKEAEKFDLDITSLLPQQIAGIDDERFIAYLERLDSRRKAATQIKRQLMEAMRRKINMSRVYPIVNWRSDGIGYNDPTNYYDRPGDQIFLVPVR